VISLFGCEAEHPVCSTCRSNFRPEEVIKAELLCYRCPYRFDQKSAFLVFLDRGILSFAFHQVLSSGAVPLDFTRISWISCSGTHGTTTDAPCLGCPGPSPRSPPPLCTSL